MKTLVDLFETFKERGDATAFVYRTGIRRFTYSYGQIYDLSLRFARVLAVAEVGVGDRVLLWGPNSPWWAVAFWGAMVRGAVVVPVDFMSDVDRAGTILSVTESKVVVQSRFKSERLNSSAAMMLEDLPSLLQQVEPLTEMPQLAVDHMAQLIYTSGTTGNPKGVILTHGNLIANLLQVNRHIPIVTEKFSFLSLLPLSHMFEQMCGFFTPLYRGATVVQVRTLKPSAIMDALAEEDIYAVIAVPRLLQLLKSSVERELQEKNVAPIFTSLATAAQGLPQGVRKRIFFPVQRKFGRNFTFFVSGGAPLTPELFQFWRKLGFSVLEGYGLTECGPVLTANTIERQVAGSVGSVLPGIELKIENKEVLARGDNVFPGYYRNEQASREAFSEGWFRTGDLGEFSPERWLWIKGRAKEMIVTGAGINVYPDELEAVLNAVAGVRESCVIGLDRRGGEEVHAVLLLDHDAADPKGIIAQANKQLDTLHRIGGYSVWAEQEFPKTTTMKVKKYLVKQRLTEDRIEGKPLAQDRLLQLIVAVTGTDAGKMREDSLLVTNLGLTSIGRLELVNYLEQEFRVDIEESRINMATTVADLRRMITAREKVVPQNHLRFWTNSYAVRKLRQLSDAVLVHPVFRHFVTVEAYGVEQLEQLQGPVFFVANHTSHFDQLAVMSALPQAVRYRTATAAWEEFYFKNYENVVQKIWKRIAYELSTWLGNIFPLPQSRGFRGSLRFMGKLADNGINILIFPEGERSIDGKLLPFQLGLGIMVNELAIPVVPVRIEGLERLLPRGASWPKQGKATVRFGAPLHFRNESPAEIVARARKAVAEL